MKGIPIIDLFAGPGGLGEGFSSVKDENGVPVFDIRLSIEKDENAHKTLTWRSFYRQFIKAGKEIPEEYYQAYREKDLLKRQQIIEAALSKYEEGKLAREEARLVELGGKEWSPEKVDELISAQLGEDTGNWVLIGGPPCQAYSVAGRSRRQEGISGLNPNDHRVHLYKEYLRIIAVHHPAVFVMENVKGLLSAQVGGVKIFDLIKSDLADPNRVFMDSNAPGYRIYSLVTPSEEPDNLGQPNYQRDKDFLIEAEKYGVPQKRHRVILLGIREDIQVEPGIIEQRPTVSLKRVIGDLPAIRSGIHRSFVDSETVRTEDGGFKTRRNYKKETDSPDRWNELINQFQSEIVKLNGFSSNKMEESRAVSTQDTGSEYVSCDTPSEENPLYDWYRDDDLGGTANHESRSHLVQDLKRYLFAGLYTEKYGKFPRLDDYASHGEELLPDHKNVESGKFTDRFRVQLPNQPATTVTSHISKDGHYFIHYDAVQCRSFTVREAARVQTFPDNYLFCGSRTAQFHQVGNAVPPFLAKQIGEIVKSILEVK